VYPRASAAGIVVNLDVRIVSPGAELLVLGGEGLARSSSRGAAKTFSVGVFCFVYSVFCSRGAAKTFSVGVFCFVLSLFHCLNVWGVCVNKMERGGGGGGGVGT
jgi:hypothetical protein